MFEFINRKGKRENNDVVNDSAAVISHVPPTEAFDHSNNDSNGPLVIEIEIDSTEVAGSFFEDSDEFASTIVESTGRAAIQQRKEQHRNRRVVHHSTKKSFAILGALALIVLTGLTIGVNIGRVAVHGNKNMNAPIQTLELPTDGGLHSGGAFVPPSQKSLFGNETATTTTRKKITREEE